MQAFDILTTIKPSHYLLDFVIYTVDQTYQIAQLHIHVHPDLEVQRKYYTFNPNIDNNH